MTDVTRRQYERAAVLAQRAARGDTYAAGWAEIHLRITNAAQRRGADHAP